MSIDLDAELERQLAKSPSEVRASLAAQGYDVAELEKEARAFLRRPRHVGRQVVKVVAIPLATLIAVATQAVNVAGPAFANRPSAEPALTVTAAAPPILSLREGGVPTQRRTRHRRWR